MVCAFIHLGKKKPKPEVSKFLQTHINLVTIQSISTSKYIWAFYSLFSNRCNGTIFIAICVNQSKLIPKCISQTCTMANNSRFKQPSPPNARKHEKCAKSIKSIVFAENRIFSRCSLNLFLAHISCLYATTQKHSTSHQQYLWASIRNFTKPGNNKYT